MTPDRALFSHVRREKYDIKEYEVYRKTESMGLDIFDAVGAGISNAHYTKFLGTAS